MSCNAVQEFCDPFGESRFTHPNHEDHLQQYLAKENLAIETENTGLLEAAGVIKTIEISSCSHGYLA
jgi:hypothetical protein